MNIFLIQALAALWVTLGIEQVMAISPDPKDSSSGIPTVKLSSQIFFTKDLQCFEELTCRVNAKKDGIKRVLGIAISERTGQTDLKKVASIDYLKTNRSVFDGDDVETIGAVLTQHGNLVVHKALPPNTGFNGEKYVCEVSYLDDDLTKHSVESQHLDGTRDNACKVSNFLDKLDALEKRLIQLKKLSNIETGKLTNLLSKVSDLDSKLDTLSETPTAVSTCDEFRGQGQGTKSRQVIAWCDGTKVMCDTKTNGGGWTIFQRRVDGHLNFFRGWKDYENGFGDPEAGEYWLGLKPLQRLLETGDYEMRVDLKFNGNDYYALYTYFKLSPPCSNYKIGYTAYSGTAGDSLKRMLGQPFSTFDGDHDKVGGNCAILYLGAWWYDRCHISNLNGIWGSTEYGKGLNWFALTTYYKSVTFSEMKVRRLS